MRLPFHLFENEDAVVPGNLRKDIFTVGEKDNISKTVHVQYRSHTITAQVSHCSNSHPWRIRVIKIPSCEGKNDNRQSTNDIQVWMEKMS